MRILGLDYGEKTIGVAVSDGLMLTAQPVEIIRRPQEESLKKSIARLAELVREYEVERIVLGYPKHTNNQEGLRCQKTVLFQERLRRNFKRMDIVLWDERYSTAAISGAMAGMSRDAQKEVVDKLAAAYILQGYLDALRQGNA